MATLYSIKPDSDANVYVLVPAESDTTEAERFTPSQIEPSIGAKSQNKSVQIQRTVSSKPTTISFVEKYKNWTVSPILNNIYDKEIKIPDIQLKEKKLISSTLWEQFKYFAYIGKTLPGTTAESLRSFPFLEKIALATQKIIDETSKKTKDLLTALEFDTPDFTNQKKEDPYEGIYALEDTRFNYILPFYTKNIRNKTNSFSETYSGDGKGIVAPLADHIKEFTEGHAQGVRAIVEPGLYIEKTQFYNFGHNTESVSFSFPLLNTISSEQISENYQFLFLLLFQNSLYRKDRSAFVPPCIYEVLIPNIRYMKYAYISNLSIDFLGTRRMIEINVPTIRGNSNIKTIVPEAYNLNITITGLHDEVANFLLRSGAQDIGSVGTVDIAKIGNPQKSPEIKA